MKLVTVSSLVLSNLLTFDTTTHAQLYLSRSDCVKMCYDYRKNQLSKQLCNPTLTMTPKPATYKSCIHGLFMGFEHACTTTCSGETYKEESGVLPGNSFEACKSEVRHSNSMDWCRHAYDVTFKITPGVILTHMENKLQNETNFNHRIMLGQDEESGSFNSTLPESRETIESQDAVVQGDDQHHASIKMENSRALKDANDFILEHSLKMEERNLEAEEYEPEMVMNDSEMEVSDSEMEVSVSEMEVSDQAVQDIDVLRDNQAPTNESSKVLNIPDDIIMHSFENEIDELSVISETGNYDHDYDNNDDYEDYDGMGAIVHTNMREVESSSVEGLSYEKKG